ncbi:hypothetical protein [Demequina sp. NBRC 110056]|uniref:hypothetical protein n=1 Tax=Demequina sp. NBRC 110056 TaxID=1570345 RepID=UPI00117BF257|nr:hypothetical protein [Demequina sp. NBRC 110056]
MPAIPDRVLRVARSVALWDPHHDVQHAALLSGSGRSGTTWLLEAYSRAGRLRPIFEPIRPDLDPRFEGLRPGRYVPADAAHLPGEQAVLEVLTGRYRHPWADQQATLNPFLRYRGRLIKEIRFPTWAGWLARRHPDVPIVHVIRHPLATLSSQSVLGWSPERFHYMLSQEALVDGLLGDVPLRSLPIDDASTALVARWAVENTVAARTYGGERSALVSYDRAVADPRELHAGAAQLGIEPSSLRDLDRPSSMTHAKGANAHASKDPLAWVARISDEQRAAAAQVLDAFEMRAPFLDTGEVDGGALQAWWSAQAQR